ncbi:MAG: DoxX family protein [Paracoccaceae bacterium]
MTNIISRFALPTIKALLTLAFLAAGIAKLAGADMMVATFDAVGIGQWFRYVTGIIEISGAILLWVPGLQLFAAALLCATMGGAVLAHFLILGPSALPATLLGLLSLIVAFSHKDQLPGTE